MAILLSRERREAGGDWPRLQQRRDAYGGGQKGAHRRPHGSFSLTGCKLLHNGLHALG